MSNNQWNCVDYCFGVCGKADSVNRSGTGSCWNCGCWIVRGNRVSCLVAIVIKDRLHGIDLFTEDRRVFTRGPGLVGNPVTPCDVIRVYTKMNENFKGGINNVMFRNNDPVDSRYHQRCANNRHWSWHTCQCVANRSGRRGGSDVWTPRFATLIGRSSARSVSSRLGTSGSSI